MKFASLLILLSLLSCNFAVETQAQQRPVRNGSGPGAAGGSARSQPLNSLPIRRVVLYSNGVAYIERRGMVSNHAEVSLSFKQSQVDDVLKSMVVLDLGKGRIGAVSYNSSAPPSSRMSEIPFAMSASTEGNSGGLAGVLSQLQGARVIVTTVNRTVTGSVITVESRRAQIDSDRPAVTTQRLVIGSENGELTAFDLSEVRSVQLADEGSRRDLTEFAHAAASARRRDAKTIVVTSDGSGEREMIVSYTIAAPIWKTTYRVLLDTSGKPFFQGWAIVDNVSEEDWNGVELSLVSGTPVSFIQPIQNPVYRYRPVVPLQDDLNLKPQTYEPGVEGGGGSTGSLGGTIVDPNGYAIAGASVTVTNTISNQSFDVTTNGTGIYQADNLPPGSYQVSVNAPNFKSMVVTNVNVSPGRRAKVDGNLSVGTVSETVTVTASSSEINATDGTDLSVQSRNFSNLAFLKPGVRGGNVGGAAYRETLSNLVSRRESGVEAETTASDIGDLFEYRIDQPVTVPRDRSALIPILQTRMEGERVSIYRGNISDDSDSPASTRPMSGMLLKNTSPLTLEDGSLTVIDGDAYAGEALLERLKPGEERLISFALDLGTLVSISDDEDRQPTFLVQAYSGTVVARYYNLRTRVYTLVNQTERPRVVYIEHPRNADENWQLVEGTGTLLDPAKTGAAAGAGDVGSAGPDSTASAANISAVTRTANFYRFRVKLAPHQKLEFPVVERNEQRDSYQLTNFTRNDLQLFIARKYIDDKTRAALEVLIDLKDRVAGAEVRLQEINKEVAEIVQDQKRLRENIEALNSTAEARQLITRYVSKANEQETRLEQLEKDRRTVTEECLRLQAELAAAIRNFALDRKLN